MNEIIQRLRFDLERSKQTVVVQGRAEYEDADSYTSEKLEYVEDVAVEHGIVGQRSMASVTGLGAREVSGMSSSVVRGGETREVITTTTT